MRCLAVVLICCLGGWAAAAEKTDLAARVLVVHNAHSRASKQVADYYAKQRGIPAANRCALKDAVLQNKAVIKAIPLAAYAEAIRKPIRKCLERVGRENILYIVFTYDTPFAFHSTPAKWGRALDQYVADIWDEEPLPTRVLNPYYAHVRSEKDIYLPFVPLAAYRSEPKTKLIYSVWRLDAATPEKNGASGQVCIDRRFGAIKSVKDEGYGTGDWQLYRAAELARSAGLRVTEDENSAEFGTAPAPARCEHAFWYAGWYSLGHYNDAFSWNPGAIGVHLDSASATSPRDGPSWAANAIAKGITVTAGSVAEPYLPGLPQPYGLLRNLLEGANVGDAFLRNTVWLKWMILYLGDPLYRPFPNGKRSPQQ
jgi:uncharacterized protein (TIGR03790 family)